MRVLVFTGKGGVGKTTAAAATAVRCARAGARTLLLSTDPAHSLADALDVALGDRPTEVGPGLWAQQLDARRRLEAQWGELRGYLVGLLDWAGVDRIEAEELTLLPGLDDLLALVDLVDQADSGEWDVLVVDCAPTAETLRLLSLPDVLSWWMERLFPLGRQVTRVVGPVVRQLSGVPVPGESVFSAVERLQARLAAVRALLTDPEVTSIRLVVNPEKVVVAEARRTATYLALFGYGLDAVVVNRVLPDEVSDPWFDRWRASQHALLDDIDAGFAPVPVLRSRLRPDEPVGVDALAALAGEIYGGTDPAAHHHRGPVMTFTAGDGVTELVLDLPFTDRRDVGLVRRGDELVVTVGPHRRAIVLPDGFAGRKVVDASVRAGRMTVVFADR